MIYIFEQLYKTKKNLYDGFYITFSSFLNKKQKYWSEAFK